MGRGLLLLLSLLLATPSYAQDWTGIDDKVRGSVFRLEASAKGDEKPGLCSAVLIADDTVLTAAHCIPQEAVGRSVAVDGKDAAIEKVNWVLDLAVLKVQGLGGKPILRRPTPAKIGTPIAAVGHAWGASRLKYTFGYIMDETDEAALLQLGAPKGSEFGVFVDAVFIGGHSGGAVVDLEGRLVSIVQARNGSAGFAIRPDQIDSFITSFIKRP